VNQSKLFGGLHQFEVEGLFGRRDFQFVLDPKEPTLLTGANGTGKSTLLRYINAIGTTQWDDLLALPPFERIILSFENGAQLRVHRQDDNRLSLNLSGEESWTYHVAPRFHYSVSNVTSDLLLYAVNEPNAAASAPAWQQEPQAAMWASNLPSSLLPLQAPDWVTELPNRFPVLYVTDQRLIVDSVVAGRDERRVTEQVPRGAAVDAAAQFIAHRMSVALSTYGTESQRLDRDFPQRVVRAMGRKREVPDSELAELLQQVEEERKSLQQVGLLTSEVISTAFDESRFRRRDVKPVIYTFARDTLQKFRTLYPIRDRLSVFADFLNQHYKSKRVVIDQQNGFRIELVGGRPEELLPSQLSSGEQQILVVAYQVLFRAEQGTLVLIDEPELSLHVLWQDTLIDDLTRMGAVTGHSFLLATHSPTLIGGREHLRRSLDPM
jgi:ABC-type lipoprotein export system ATPase subunit